MRSRFSSRRRTAEEAQIDLTPMLDIVFIMLIFFVVSSSFTQSRQLPLQLPEAQGHKTAAQVRHVQLTADGQLGWQGTPITRQQLAAHLAQLSPESSLVVEADSDVPHGLVVALLEQAKQAGVTRLAVAVEQK